ncbi:DUF4339 domain-containing protein [Pleionea sp. CnH1-48]|uniref:DUF4339 domain-containing protein n=1 Tax=Pleionea sp. CnH1-48 TaxID=2954494 RepID=UPI002096FEAC|nr:DUF4339 domain-containing protein [Pleionea sp. CnH1-48]MCO7226816.1 DUF4339 domain-containing protein [Pleionea sp. CnH1-48]
MLGKTWYFSRSGRVEGPFTSEQIQARVKIFDDALVWNPSLDGWQKARLLMKKVERAVPPALNKVADSPSDAGLKRLRQEKKLWEVRSKAMVAKSLKEFAQKSLQLEQAPESDRRAALMQFIQKQHTNLENAKLHLQNMKQSEGRARRTAVAKKKASVKRLPSKTPTQRMLQATSGSGNRSAQAARQIRLAAENRRKVHPLDSLVAANESSMAQPEMIEIEGQSLLQDQLKLVVSENTQAVEKEDKQQMMKRVVRRRRRRR